MAPTGLAAAELQMVCSDLLTCPIVLKSLACLRVRVYARARFNQVQSLVVQCERWGARLHTRLEPDTKRVCKGAQQ
eukprot:4724225-Amphidinium_carterae.1